MLKPTVHVQYYWQLLWDLAIYWSCRCGCSTDWEQRSINETDHSILSLHQYISKRLKYIDTMTINSDICEYILCVYITFQYIVHVLSIPQYILRVCVMWQSIGYQQPLWSIYWTQ